MVADVPTIRRKLTENIKRVRERIAEACARARRNVSDVTLIAVTKQVEIDIIRQALDLGLTELGENRGQQLNQRAAMMHEFVTRRHTLTGGAPARPRWHMIGHLQRNKVKLVLPWADMIHSVDSLRLAEEINQQAEKLGRTVNILLEVNVSGERSKFGVAVGAVRHIMDQLSGEPGVTIRGLMTMAPLDATTEEIRLYFSRLRELFDEFRECGNAGPRFDSLSMGMSNDYVTAIECGATIIRLGHALFEGLTSGPDVGPDEDSAGMNLHVEHWFDPRTMDLFEFWRFILSATCIIFAAIVTGQSLFAWIEYFAGDGRKAVVLRRYVIVQLLRLRVRRFASELVPIVAWTVVLIVLIRMH